MLHGIVEREVERFCIFAVFIGNVIALVVFREAVVSKILVAVVVDVFILDHFDVFAVYRLGVLVKRDVGRFGKGELVGYIAEFGDEAISCLERLHKARGRFVYFDDFVHFELIHDFAYIVEGSVLFGQRFHKDIVSAFDSYKFVEEHIVESCADVAESVAAPCHLLKSKSSCALRCEVISRCRAVGIGVVETVSCNRDECGFALRNRRHLAIRSVRLFFVKLNALAVRVYVVGNVHFTFDVCAVRCFCVQVVFYVEHFAYRKFVCDRVDVFEGATSVCKSLHNRGGLVLDVDEFVDFKFVDFRAYLVEFAVFESDDCLCGVGLGCVDDVAYRELVEKVVGILKFHDGHIRHDLKDLRRSAFAYAQVRLSAACFFAIVEGAEHTVFVDCSVHNIEGRAFLVRSVFEFVFYPFNVEFIAFDVGRCRECNIGQGHESFRYKGVRRAVERCNAVGIRNDIKACGVRRACCDDVLNVTIVRRFVLVCREAFRIAGIVHDVFFVFLAVFALYGLFDVAKFFFDEFVRCTVVIGVDCAGNIRFNAERGGVIRICKVGF